MKQNSLQKIEDKYVAKGLKGKMLKAAIEKDKKYQALLRVRKEKMKKRFMVRPGDKKKYVLSTDADLEILNRIYTLEAMKLSETDRHAVQLIKNQLKLDWRTPLNRELNRLLRKYEC